MKPRSNCATAIAFTFLIFAGAVNLQAQDWPVNHAPLQGAVPQYVSPQYGSPQNSAVQQAPARTMPRQNALPSYPLYDEPVKQKIESKIPARPAVPIQMAPPQKNTALPAAKKQALSKKKEKQKLAPHYGIDFSIYRDKNPYPIDPRKPCNNCVRPYGNCAKCNCDLPGVKGQPYMDQEPGGCKCEKKNPARKPDFSVYWPRPFSARQEARQSESCGVNSGCPKKHLNDIFDPLSTFKLSKFKRTDNGYCGSGADPYGCLGESKHSR
ncbi:MAG: hypothetical protein AB8B55_00960 [Mariniblastus sp.]